MTTLVSQTFTTEASAAKEAAAVSSNPKTRTMKSVCLRVTMDLLLRTLILMNAQLKTVILIRRLAHRLVSSTSRPRATGGPDRELGGVLRLLADAPGPGEGIARGRCCHKTWVEISALSGMLRVPPALQIGRAHV